MLLLYGDGYENARTEAQPYASAGGRVAWAVPVSDGLFVDVVADLEVPFLQTGVRIGEALVWRTQSVSGGASVGLGWRL